MKVTFVKSTETGGMGGIGPQGSAGLAERQHFSSSCAQGNINFPSTTKIVAVSSLRIVILSIASPRGKNQLESLREFQTFFNNGNLLATPCKSHDLMWQISAFAGDISDNQREAGEGMKHFGWPSADHISSRDELLSLRLSCANR